ncbi:MAG: ATP-binding protein [Elusimicrobiaceae bacterium]|nr:ATP-binding protein [Elusimicrobiaceae bacterium]
MKYTYEDRRAFFYMDRLLDVIIESEDSMDYFMDWSERLQLYKDSSKGERTNRRLKSVYKKFRKKLKQMAIIPAETEENPFYLNLMFLKNFLNLSSEEIAVLEVAFLWKNNKFLKDLSRRRICNSDLTLDYCVELANTTERAMKKILNPQSSLLRYSFLIRDRFDKDYSVGSNISNFLESIFENEEERKSWLMGSPLCGNLRSKDFEYIPETDFAVNLLKNNQGQKGFNILLYGMAGTGKTSFAQMLAKETGKKLYVVGETNEGESQDNYRLRSLYLKNDFLKKAPDSCLLFDEAEDLFSSSQTKCDKVEINRLLEKNKVPVIWTTNRIDRMDPAFIRRFSLAIYFKKPPVEVQRKIWQKHLKENSLPHSYCQTMALAKEFSVPPSMISGAAKAAHIVNGDLDTVRNHIEIMQQALNYGFKRKKKEETKEVKNEKFNPLLINADTDLAALSEQLKKLGRLNFSLCLYGAPGTGKSAYGRYLAEELGLKVLHKRASDLLGAYVGETEHNIARAFAEAKENKALLIFDEADSFLQDRKYAQRSWEVSSVNEMLTWMESHPYPFICTTNLMNRLDPASLRRFSFKVKYEFLNTPQVQTAFEHFFGVKVSNQDVASLAALTPGDFALVKNKAEILGVLKQPEKLKELLQAEQKVKTQHTTGQIGFCPR